jgi:hypothetical protein
VIEVIDPRWIDDCIEAFRDALRQAMPRDSMILDLWCWDVHLEDGDHLSDDWLIEAAFGDDDSLEWCVEELVELFLRRADEYNMDYNRHEDPGAFTKLVEDASEAFIFQWRLVVQSRVCYVQRFPLGGAR